MGHTWDGDQAAVIRLLEIERLGLGARLAPRAGEVEPRRRPPWLIAALCRRIGELEARVSWQEEELHRYRRALGHRRPPLGMLANEQEWNEEEG